MHKKPKISIITPSYNQGKYIEETINSVLSQAYANLEYIIIDGGSTDNSSDIVKKYEKHLTYWVSEQDNGQSHAINKGFCKATGDVIAWINSDDFYLPGTFKYIAELFERNPTVEIIYGDVINFTEQNEYYYKVKEFEPLDFLSRISIHQPGVFWRRKLLDEVGFLDEQLHFAMDYDLWMRLFFNYKSLKVNKPLAKFRMHEGSKTTNTPPELYKDCRLVLSRFFNSVNKPEIIKKLKELGLFHNNENHNYKLQHIDDKIIVRSFTKYIFNYAIEEHTFGDKKLANQLFWISLKNGYLKSLYFLAKNNLF